MKMIFKKINDYQVVEDYYFSDKFFAYDNKVVSIENKLSKLVYLIGLTSKWKENKLDVLERGFYLHIDFGDYKKEYFITNEYEENFIMFLSEIKRIMMEGK